MSQQNSRWAKLAAGLFGE